MTTATPKPKGFWRKVLHYVGTGLKLAGEYAIQVALSKLENDYR